MRHAASACGIGIGIGRRHRHRLAAPACGIGWRHRLAASACGIGWRHRLAAAAIGRLPPHPTVHPLSPVPRFIRVRSPNNQNEILRWGLSRRRLGCGRRRRCLMRCRCMSSAAVHQAVRLLSRGLVATDPTARSPRAGRAAAGASPRVRPQHRRLLDGQTQMGGELVLGTALRRTRASAARLAIGELELRAQQARRQAASAGGLGVGVGVGGRHRRRQAASAGGTGIGSRPRVPASAGGLGWRAR